MTHPTLEQVDAAFAQLREGGFIAEPNFLCCQSCGMAAIDRECGANTKGVVFYHKQDYDYFKGTGKLMLSYDGHRGTSQLQAGLLIYQAMREAGLTVDWDGSPKHRIEVAA